ncbi:nucleotide-diphospho-sugar transferase [Armillaria borealis]|uniref:Translation initiation factor eIF2B subunit epsilon n=1 Tax=Armillaria borealis TaxID=47425 RepID=A0AA39MYE2_9AGAR|nr:nucleotide-diphospho-sugar transferase [Armillaria borealis]
MAPKSSSHGKDKLIGADDDVLQAVVLADSFNKRFKPLTTRKPRCLLPVCNAPLLDWTFESLALAGVQEIFVMCRSHAEQVKAAIAESRWSKPGSGLKIETYSPGDAMRDVYTRGLVTSDFVLVMGDLVSNIRIDEVVRVHKERRKTNKDAIMTMVVKESGVKHRTRSKGDSSVFVLDTETSECLHYEPVTGYPPTKKAHIPREIFAEHPEVEIRNDLIDCSIDVCSVEVPSLFQDNFDYLDLRRDFVHGVLTSDLLMKNIYCYIAKEGYAARVKDTRSYDSVSKDILSRWAFPLVPDDNHPGGHAYEHIRGNKYIAKGSTVTLARTSTVGNNTLIGSGTQILEDVQIKSSVIGHDCIIGAGSIITDSYIFDGASIGPECMVEKSIIGEGVIIKDRSRIVRGCLLGDEVVVGPGAVLPPFERLSKKRNPEDEEEDEDEEDSDLEEIEATLGARDTDLKTHDTGQSSIFVQLGKDSNAIVWPRDAPDDEDEDDVENHTNQRFMRLGDDPSDLEDDSSASSDGEDGSSSDEDDDFKTSLEPGLVLDKSAINLPSSDVVAENEFRAEVTQSLERAFAEGHSIDNAAVELKTLRMASNVPLSRVREAVVAAIVERVRIVESGGAPQRTEITNVIQRWGGLIDRIGGVDAVETISVLQTHCSSSERMPLFGQILAALYQADIVEEEDLRAGVGLTPGTQTDNIRKCWNSGDEESEEEIQRNTNQVSSTASLEKDTQGR